MASVYEQILARQRGSSSSSHPTRTSQPGFNPQTGALDPGPVGGFLASALSAFPEFLGADPVPVAAAFRAEHPWLGFASELPALTVPYAGAFRLSRIPALAAGLERTVARVADPVLRPVVAGTTREIVRYAPLEASRLAIGGIIHPDNFGELFADVAFSTAIAGGIGAVGGIFRAGGRAVRDPEARVLGADVTAAPTIQLQMLRAGGEVADPALGREGAERLLIDDVFSETAGTGFVSKQRLPTLAPLEGARGRADTDEVNALFRLNDARAPVETGVDVRLLREGDEANFATLDTGGQAQLVADLQTAGAAVEDISQLAESVFFPRLLRAVDNRGAAAVGRLTENPTMTRMNDNLWLGREESEGLFVGLLRMGGRPRDELDIGIDALREAGERMAGQAPKRAKHFGPGRVEAGEQFLLFKTNNPARFAPAQHAVLERNYATWAGWRQAYQEPLFNLSRLGQAENEMLQMLSPQDFRDLHRFSRATWVSRVSDRVTKRVTGELGLTDSSTGRAFAEQAYDAIAPTMFKQGKNSLYARFEATMRVRVRAVNEQLNKMFVGQTAIRGSLWQHVRRRDLQPAYPEGTFAQNIMGLSDDEFELLVKAQQSQTPVAKLVELAPGGVVSDRLKQTVANLNGLDRRYLSETVLPELEAAGLKDTFQAIEGTYLPAARLGDFFQTVRAEGGSTVALVTGKTGAQANRQANAIVAEAKRQGREWSTTRAEIFHAIEREPDELDKLFRETMTRLARNEPDDAIVRGAMQKLRYMSHPSSKRGVPLVAGAPSSFAERSGLHQIVELPSRKEYLKQIYSHYEQLGKYAAMQGWSERWGNELMRFSKYEPTLFHDLKRKRAQYLGIEGQITNTMNKTLQPVLGHLMGAKPATRIAQVTNELMYNFNLAWVNPTFALLNSLTPIMTALPQIAYTLRASPERVARLYQVMPAYGANGPVGVAAHLSPLKVLWQAVRDMRSPDPEFRQMVRELTDDGSLHAQLFEEFIGQNALGPRGLRETFRNGDYVDFFREGSTWMARKSEEFSRVVSAAAGFRLGRDAMGLAGPQLKQFTRRFVETTNYMYGVVDRPRVFTGPLGSVFGLFKNWQMHYLGMMSEYAGLAWKEGVYSPILWQHSAALALGGLGATPLRHLADGISNWYTGDPESYRQLLENWPNAADEIWFGLPAFAGVSLQTSAAIPGTDVRNEITSLGNIVAWERAKQLGTAIGSAIDHSSATGENAFENPNVRDQLLAALTPRVISRAVSTTEGDYVRSMRTGYPQVRELGPVTSLFHGLGMNQVDVERQQRAARELHHDQERRRALITGLGGAYAQATLRGDAPEAEQIIQRSIMLGLPLSSVMRSAQNFQRRETESDSLSRFDRMEAGRWVAALDQAAP